MLFRDDGCDSDITIERQYSHQIHKLLGSDWFGIVSLSKSGHGMIDSSYDVNGVGDAVVIEFVEAHADALQCQDYAQKQFQHAGKHFAVFPIRENESGYLIFFVHCKKQGPFNQKDIDWYIVYADTAYTRLLLNNELIQERNYMQQVLESTESIITVFDGQYNVVTSNDPDFNLLSANLNSPKFSHMDDKTKRSMTKLIDEVIATNTRRRLDNVVIVRNGVKRILNITLSPLCNSKEAVSGVVMVGTDITQKQMMEYEFEQIKHYVLLGEISLALSRDVNPPLMNIRSCASFLKKRGQLDPESQEMLDVVVGEVKRIDEIMSQMLSFVNVPKRNTHTLVNIHEILNNCIQIVNRQKSCRWIKVNYCPGKDLPLIEAKNTDMQQIFLNVLLNSLQAIEEEGQIDISSFFDAEQRKIHVVISDDGCGIAEADKDKIFSPYHSTKTNGTGLGLFMVKRAVEKYKGSIHMESTQHKGTTCTITLPCHE